MLTVSYLWNANIYLVNPANPNGLTPMMAAIAALSFLLVFWVLYDAICRVFGQRKNGDGIVGASDLAILLGAWTG